MAAPSIHAKQRAKAVDAEKIIDKSKVQQIKGLAGEAIKSLKNCNNIVNIFAIYEKVSELIFLLSPPSHFNYRTSRFATLLL